MTNANTIKGSIYKSRIATKFYQGYLEFQSGLAYFENKEYQTWPEMDQKNYEIGRLYAADGGELNDYFKARVPKRARQKAELTLAIASIEL